MGLDNFDFMCYPKISFRYRKHSHLPHAHILVLVRMGPTNQETLLWLQSLTGPKYSSSTLEQAKNFFGSFDGDRKGFNLWKENSVTHVLPCHFVRLGHCWILQIILNQQKKVWLSAHPHLKGTDSFLG